MKGANMETISSKHINDILDSIDPIDQEKVDAKMIIAAKIEDAMKNKGWRKTDLLKALKKENPSVITKWLSGTHNFTVETLVELGHALGINLLDLTKPEGKVIIYVQSVSQKAKTTCDEDFYALYYKKGRIKRFAYSPQSYPSTYESSKSLAQA